MQQNGVFLKRVETVTEVAQSRYNIAIDLVSDEK